MNINTQKTKEMVIGPLIRNPPTQITIGDRTVDKSITVYTYSESP